MRSCRTQITFPEIEGRRSATTTSRRAWASPTTCSATARRRSSSTSGKYLEAAVNGNGNYSALLPDARASTSTQTRTWTDANGNFTPDCDLLSGAAQDLRASRRRLLRRLGQPELRQGVDASGNPIYSLRYAEKILQGLGRAAVRLADRRHAAAGDPAARVDRSRLHAPLAAELHGHRQPGTSRPADFDHVQRRRAVRSAPARRRRLHGHRALQRQAGQVLGAAEQPAHLRARLRRRSRRSTTASTSTSTRGCGTACSCRPAPAPDSA